MQNEKNDLDMAQLAKKQYMDTFQMNKEEKQVDAGDSTAGTWLNNPNSWRRLAEKCTASGHFVFAVDCYQQALERGMEAKVSKKICRAWENVSFLFFYTILTRFARCRTMRCSGSPSRRRSLGAATATTP